MAKELSFILMDDLIKVILTMILNKEKAINIFLMDLTTQVILNKDIKKVEVYFNGPMDKSMMVNGYKVKKMEVECGKVIKVIHILDSGKRAKFKVLEYLLQKMVIVMKVNLENHRNMVLEHKDMSTVIRMLDYFVKIDLMVMDNFIIKMVIIIKDNLQTD